MRQKIIFLFKAHFTACQQQRQGRAKRKFRVEYEDYFTGYVSFYVSIISAVVEEGSRISVDDCRSWELNGKLSKGEANMNCSAHWCSRWITLGVEYWSVMDGVVQNRLCLPLSGKLNSSKTWSKPIDTHKYFLRYWQSSPRDGEVRCRPGHKLKSEIPLQKFININYMLLFELLPRTRSDLKFPPS